MVGDLPIWIAHYAELLGCDRTPAAIALAIENLLGERERQRQTIGRLRGRNAELQRAAMQKGCAP